MNLPVDVRRALAGLSARQVSILVGLLSVVLTGIVALVVSHERGITGDEPFYVSMANHPGGEHNFPYAYRVVVPWLVHLLPFSDIVAFTVVGVVCIGCTATALYLLLMEFEVESLLATGLVVGFILSPTLWVVIVRHFRSIDPASILVMVLGCLWVVRRKRLALLVTLTIGTGVRESTLFLIPFAYAMWAERPIDPRALRDVAMTCLVPIVVYVVLRTQVDAVGKQFIPGYSGPFLHARVDFLRRAQWSVELRRLAYTYGPIWIVAPFALATSRYVRRGLVIVVLCVVSMTYAYDWGRVIFLAGGIFIPAAAIVLRSRRYLAIAAVVAFLAVDVGYGVYLQSYGLTHGLDSSAPVIPVYTGHGQQSVPASAIR